MRTLLPAAVHWTPWQLAAVLCLLWLTTGSARGQLSKNKEKLLNWCLDSKHHKDTPGPEGSLYSQCKPWEKRACCRENTTHSVHTAKLYNFDWDHCHEHTGLNLSAACRRHFVQDTCFYECEPNLGPWVVRVNRTFAKERFLNVPLCASDCQRWFDDCRDDYTCVANWPRNFVFRQGRNYCPQDVSCMPFRRVYKNAKDFCEQVFDYSWKHVPDTEPCMRMWFNGSSGNPNDAVAKIQVTRLLGGGAGSVSHLPPATVAMTFAFLLHVVALSA